MSKRKKQEVDQGEITTAPSERLTAASLQEEVRRLRCRDKKTLARLQGFFKTGKGEYGEHDRFLGLTMPQLRGIVKAHRPSQTKSPSSPPMQSLPLPLPLSEVEALLESPYNEERCLALIFLVDFFQQLPGRQEEIFNFYCQHRHRVNNWNLVDISCYHIIGIYLMDKPRDLLLDWARSPSLWDRRIAIVSTWSFIRQDDLTTTWQIADMLLEDKEDLIHKAVGWMLREAGKRDKKALTTFLAERAHRMPRVMLRYALEKFPPTERKRYLKATEPLSL
eukprot:gene6178-6813_t